MTFSLVDSYTGAPYVLQSCETGVFWTFGDGTNAQTTTTSVQHTYATGGQFNAAAQVQGSSRVAYAYLVAATGTMSITSYPPDVTEGGTTAVTVHTTYAPTSVSYQVYDYRNAAGRITPVSGTLTFAAGEFDKTISIPTIDDSLYQADGAIGLTLTNPTNGVMLKDQYGNVVSGSLFAYANLLDNDPPPILNWSAPKYTVSEGAGTATLTVVRTGDMTRTVGVTYYIQSGPYTYGNLTFAPNETTKTITLSIPNDTVWTPDRVWSVEITSPSGGAVIGSLPYYSYYSYATVVITDDEPAPTISISDASVTEGNSGKKTANLTLTLSTPLAVSCSANITYSGTATRTVDYDAPTTSVFFNAGETTKTIPITVYGDTLIERDETVVATIASVTNSYYSYPLPPPNVPAIAKGTGTLAILNDDIGMPWLKLAAGTSGRMTIYLGNPTTAQDSVTVTSSKPEVAKVPSSFVAETGRSTLDFNVDAGSPGASLITVKFPPTLGGGTLTAYVNVYTPAALTMQPPSLSVPVNTTGALTVTMSPAPTAPASVKITSSNASLIQAPADVTIDTTGTGTVNVKGLAVGNAALTFTLPDDNGGFDTTVAVNVTAPPTGVFVSQVSPS
ncbi:MAG TPA: Calx-beta domain-containing protein, partial [Thermoanaerobaculia bacterium]|nr:Calx-beta domain-containing protein [Thermoanaerobaculia bacterium]